jgi:hypothetical protein
LQFYVELAVFVPIQSAQIPVRVIVPLQMAQFIRQF